MSPVATYTWTARFLGHSLHGFLLLDSVGTLWNGEQKIPNSNIVMLSLRVKDSDSFV